MWKLIRPTPRNLRAWQRGLLELLALVIVGKWSWQNLSTSDKRNAVIARLQTLRQEYLG